MRDARRRSAESVVLRCCEAIAAFEQQHGIEAAKAEEVWLGPHGKRTPCKRHGHLRELDTSLAVLKSCKHLSLSTNAISEIKGLQGLDCLQVLSLGRNLITSIGDGLSAVGTTLLELWLSFNPLESLAGIEQANRLQVLYLSNTLVDSWAEVDRLKELHGLRDFTS